MIASEPAPTMAGGSTVRLRTATRIGRNFSFRLGAQVLSALINVTGMVLLGNYLAADGYGQYAFYYALIPLIASLRDLGVGVIVTKEIARNRAAGARYLGDALMIKGVVASAILIGVLTLTWLFVDPAHAALIILVSATALIDFSQDTSVWVVRAHERQDLEAMLLMVSQLGWLGGIGLCVFMKAPLTLFLASATAAFIVRSLVGSMIVSRILYRPHFKFDAGRIVNLIREGIPYGLAMFGVVFYGRLGVLLLQAFGKVPDIAYYNIAYMLSQPLGFISTALSLAAFPALARFAQQGPDALRPALRRTAKYQLLVTLPVMVGLFILSDRLIPLLFHRGGFQQAGLALKIMSMGLTFIFLNLMSRYVLTAMDQQRLYLRAIIIGLAVNFVLGMILIRSWGFVGACIAQVVAEFGIFVTCQVTLAKYVSPGDLFREAIRPVLAATTMGGVVLLIQHAHLILVVASGAATYVGMLFLLKALTPEEIQILRGVYVSFRLPGSSYLTRFETDPDRL